MVFSWKPVNPESMVLCQGWWFCFFSVVFLSFCVYYFPPLRTNGSNLICSYGFFLSLQQFCDLSDSVYECLPWLKSLVMRCADLSFVVFPPQSRSLETRRRMEVWIIRSTQEGGWVTSAAPVSRGPSHPLVSEGFAMGKQASHPTGPPMLVLLVPCVFPPCQLRCASHHTIEA